MGFRKQLEFFETMNCQVNKNSGAFKAYQLEKMSYFKQMGMGLFFVLFCFCCLIKCEFSFATKMSLFFLEKKIFKKLV